MASGDVAEAVARRVEVETPAQPPTLTDHPSPRRPQHLRDDAEPQGRRWSTAAVAGVVAALLAVVGALGSGALSGDSADPAGPPTTVEAAAATLPPVPTPSAAYDPIASVSPDATGDWVATLVSLPADADADDLEAALGPLRGVVPSARIVSSEDHASLPPARLFVIDGPFLTAADAVEYCVGISALTGVECEARLLTDDRADRDIVCRRRGDDLVGDCD